MKIGFITNFFLPQRGGGAVRNKYLVDNWSKQGNVEIEVVTVRSKLKFDDPFNKNVKIHRIPYQPADNRKHLTIRLLSELYFAILMFFKIVFLKVDLFYVTSPSFLLLFPVMIIAKLKRKPYIVDVRDHYPDIIIELGKMPSDSIRARFLYYLEKQIYDHSLFVSTVTDGLVETIQPRTKRVVYLFRNGVDKEVFYPMETQKENFSIIFHGNIGKLTNVDILIDYAKFLKKKNINNIKITIVGVGARQSEILHAIKKYDLWSIIDFKGELAYEEIPKYLNAADVGIIPNLNVPLAKHIFSVKTYEYMGCGLPIIASPHGEIGSFIEKNKIGYQFAGKSAEKLHKIILSLMNDKTNYQELHKNSLKFGEKFDRNRIAGEYFNTIIDNLNYKTDGQK